MFTDVFANKLAEDLFGYRGKTTRLPGECDHNFHLKSDDGQEFLLKISHDTEEHSIIEMQNEVLLKIQSAALPFALPHPIPTLTGKQIGRFELRKGHYHMVRLFTFVPGDLFAYSRPYSMQLLESLGGQLGHLSQRLIHIQHPEAQRFLKWDLKQANWIADYLHSIDNIEDQQLVRHYLTQFEAEVAPVLPVLRQSVIHGDINDYNVLVSRMDETEYVSGFIDFGDVIETSTICELAITLTYAIMDHPQPLKAASYIIKAYHDVFPLEEREVDILFDLIAIRLCTSVVNSAIRKKENPNQAYLVISEKPAWNLLRVLGETDVSLARNVFRQACGFDTGLSHDY